MLPPLFACEYCGKEINPNDPSVWTLVQGWVQPRKPSAGVKYQSPPHGWACHSCMTTRKYSSDQSSLF